MIRSRLAHRMAAAFGGFVLATIIGNTPVSAAPGDDSLPHVQIPNVQKSSGGFGLEANGPDGGNSVFCKPPADETDEPDGGSDQAVAASASASPSPSSGKCFKLPTVTFGAYTPCQPIQFVVDNPNTEMVPFQLLARVQSTEAPLEVTALAGAFMPARFHETGVLDFDGGTAAVISIRFGLWLGTDHEVVYPTPLTSLLVDERKCPRNQPPALKNRDGSSSGATLTATSRKTTEAPAQAPQQAAPQAAGPSPVPLAPEAVADDTPTPDNPDLQAAANTRPSGFGDRMWDNRVVIVGFVLLMVAAYLIIARRRTRAHANR